MSSGTSVIPTSGGSNGTVRSATAASDRSATSGIGADVGDTSFAERLAVAEREVDNALRRAERGAAGDEDDRTESASTGTASNEAHTSDAAQEHAAADRAAHAGEGSGSEKDADGAQADGAADDDVSGDVGVAVLTAPTLAPPPLRTLSLEVGAPTAVSGSRIAAALEALVAAAQRGTGAAAPAEKAPRAPSVDAGAATPAPFSVDGTNGEPSAAPTEPSTEAESLEAVARTAEPLPTESRAEARTDHQAIASTANDGGEFEVHVATETRSNIDVVASNERAARVLEQVRLFVQPGMRRATLELTPANLGRIDVEISVDRGELAAHLRVDAIDTYEALQRHMPELRASLERAGLDVTQLELSFGARGETASQQRGEEHTSASGNGSGTSRGSAARDESRALALVLRPNTIAIDRVDTLA